MNVISCYALQSRSQVEKAEQLRRQMKLQNEETVLLSKNVKGHVHQRSDAYKDVHEGFGYGVRTSEGEKVQEYVDAV